ncbi:hypothetical protein DPMN_021536 [Dreissena polymorpha]|uniref:Uncharacterized protein n=1 Tax=Dreissena polymorpha TaxID=45954 RepID=A0A9D4NIR3_DREPO|nr:hypothetical protein DPMN_021536 [Dreissena polymorpha]
MDYHMGLQVALPVKPFLADIALERFLTGVDKDVSGKLRVGTKQSPAHLTHFVHCKKESHFT